MKTVIAIIFAVIIIGGSILLTRGDSSTSKNIPKENISVQNVSIVDGKQIIEIKAKGGYTPRISYAKADLPTILRFNTNGTFDCSSSVNIPSMKINKVLTQTGFTDIDLGNPKLGTLNGTCGMGMYPFQIEFQS